MDNEMVVMMMIDGQRIQHDVAFRMAKKGGADTISKEDETFVYLIHITPQYGELGWLVIPKWMFDDASVDVVKWSEDVALAHDNLYTTYVRTVGGST